MKAHNLGVTFIKTNKIVVKDGNISGDDQFVTYKNNNIYEKKMEPDNK